ncbi:hypothetical protein ACNAT8_27785 [Klebsiella quasipneumoniae]|uniref:hypothetical protein n=1 Tax=Klebsiella quasipneumoniae TaxID=1463165 RepID=UPI002AB9647F|nr:hypothetical protein [Klebsiella quasipneumoniae]MDZ1466397.1 hypothetical protein [Klebsiella quasipneumoniae]
MKDFSALDSWLKVSTWDSLHPKDDERFYKAIYSMIMSNDELVDSNAVKNYILQFFGKTDENTYYLEKASLFANRYDVICNFIYENKIAL